MNKFAACACVPWATLDGARKRCIWEQYLLVHIDIWTCLLLKHPAIAHSHQQRPGLITIWCNLLLFKDNNVFCSGWRRKLGILLDIILRKVIPTDLVTQWPGKVTGRLWMTRRPVIIWCFAKFFIFAAYMIYF